MSFKSIGVKECFEYYITMHLTIDMIDGSWRSHPFADEQGKYYDDMFT